MDRELALGPEERAEILTVWDRLRAEPPPAPRPPYGCATLLIAAALFLIVPQLPRLTGWVLPSWVHTALLWILGLAMAVGSVFSFLVVGGTYARASARARESLEWLAANPGSADPSARRRHAITALYFAVESDGPTTSGTFDVDDAAKRLGANLPYVLAVEHVVAEERGLWPVFRLQKKSEG